MKVREVIRVLRAGGWFFVRQRGSHRQWKHPFRRGCVTVAGHLNDDVAPGTLASITRRAHLEFRKEARALRHRHRAGEWEPVRAPA